MINGYDENTNILMRRSFSILLISAFFVLPSLVWGAEPKGLVPCDGAASADGKSTECQVCHAIELGQNIINFLVIIASSIAVAIFAWAGFLMITAAGNEGQITKAHGMFWNVLLGLVITLAGWLIIDTVMKWAFQGPDGGTGSDLYREFKTSLGPWNQIKCAELPPNRPPGTGVPPTASPSPSPSPGGPRGSGTLCPSFNPGCSPEALTAVGYTETQARVMSCIAMTESSGILTAINPRGGACGTFQILPSNWRNPALHQGDCSAATSCTNARCNAQSAFLLSQNRTRRGQSPYGDWTCPGCNSRAQGCIDSHGQPPPGDSV